MKIKERIAGILYPRLCPVCGRILSANDMREAEEQGRNPFICEECTEKLDFMSNTPRCMLCSRPIEDEEAEYCADCQRRVRSFDGGIALMYHAGPAAIMMYEIKYENMLQHVDFIGYETVARLGRVVSSWGAEAVLPVPLHRRKLIARGYNQAQAIAESMIYYMKENGYFAPRMDTDYLIRNQQTSALKTLSGNERAAMLGGAFAVSGPFGRYNSVIIVDDIFTTGATINECAKALKAAGVRTVRFVTVTIGGNSG